MVKLNNDFKNYFFLALNNNKKYNSKRNLYYSSLSLPSSHLNFFKRKQLLTSKERLMILGLTTFNMKIVSVSKRKIE